MNNLISILKLKIMKLNKIYFLLFLIFLGAGLNSCNDDFMDIKPLVNKLDLNSYVTEQDALDALATTYKALTCNHGLENVPMNSDIFSDDAYAAGEPGGGMWESWQPIELGIPEPTTESTELWAKFWAGVYRANTYLDKESGIEWKTPGKEDIYKGEALTLRAYFYWELERLFGWVPIFPQLPPDVKEVSTVAQNSPDEVYKFIAGDLLTAMTLLPEKSTDPTQTGHINRDVARVLMSRIYLYYQNFVKPVIGQTGGYTISPEWTDGTTVIDKAYVQSLMENIITSNRYQLLDNYADVFSWDIQNSKESIFEWQYSTFQGSAVYNDFNSGGNYSVTLYGIRGPSGDSTIISGWSFATMSFTLYNEFEAGDPRKNVTVYNAQDSLTSYTPGFENTGLFNYKYLPRSKYKSSIGDPLLNWPDNYRDMRYAEVLLNAAELYLQDDPGKALGYLNQVRTRAMGDGAALSAIDIDVLTHERRVEFAFEGQRKWYLLERGLDYAKLKIDASFDTTTMPSYVTKSDFIGRGFNKDTWGMLPIPASELQLNPNLKQFVPAFQ
jgi:starch-binding outer membrane protein, SusD/RagB family